MDQAYRERRREQFTHLGTGELLSAGGFVLAAYAWSLNMGSRAGVIALWAALAPLVVVLLQAGVYWLAARAWVGCGVMPPAMARAYRTFRVIDVAVLVAAAVAVVVAWPPGPGPRVLVVVVWLFAVVEYLNYFVVRLSYGPRRWFSSVGQWRTPRLVRDLTYEQPIGRRMPGQRQDGTFYVSVHRTVPVGPQAAVAAWEAYAAAADKFP